MNSTLKSVLAWWLVAVLTAGLVAWMSVQLQRNGFAPVVISSLLTGSLLGFGLAAAMYATRFADRPNVLISVLLIALLTAAMQHAVAFAQYRAELRRAVADNPRLGFATALHPEMGPKPWDRYLRESAERGATRWWILDASLIAAGSLAVVAVALRRPYCKRCQCWYRTTRRGPLAPASIAQLADHEAFPVPPLARDVWYQWQSCPDGFHPARLRLSWTDDNQRQQTANVWLAEDDRRAAENVLRSPP